MSISEPFIHRPIGTTLLAIGLALIGAMAYAFLPVAPLPNTDMPVISVVTAEPGADPVTMAATVTAPLERHLGQIAGVNEMTSTTALGRSVIILQFDLTHTVTDAARDVQAAINAATPDLPAGLPSSPAVHKVNPNDRPIMTLALTSPTLTVQALYDATDSILAQRLSQVEGVARAATNGAAKSAIRIRADSKALAARKVSMADISTAVSSANVIQPVGLIDTDEQTLMLATNDQMTTAEDYRDLVIRTAGGGVFRLGDVAVVEDGMEDKMQAGWFGDQPAVLVSVLKQPGANVIKTVDLIKAELAQVQRWMPPSVTIHIINDQTGAIRASVDDVQVTMLISIALVILVVGLFLRRLAPTLAAATAVPLSLAGTFAIMWLLDYSLDNLSLMALTISVGFVVDDAIVMIENAARHREMGKSSLRAALDGAREIGFTIVSMTLSLVAVFVPFAFIGGLVGRLFHEFALVLAVSVMISGVISLTFTPMICGNLAGRGPGFGTAVVEMFNRGIDRLQSLYVSSLGRIIRFRKSALVLIIAMTVGSAWLFISTPKNSFPQQDTGLIRGLVSTRSGTSFPYVEGKVKVIEDIIASIPDVSAVGGTTSGASSGGDIIISLKPLKERRHSAQEVVEMINDRVADIDDVDVNLRAEQYISAGTLAAMGRVQMSLEADNIDDLYQWAPVIKSRMKSDRDVFRLVYLNDTKKGLDANVEIDRDAAARLGITPYDIDRSLVNSFGQNQISTIYTDKAYNHVILEEMRTDGWTPENLLNLDIPGRKAMVPLSTVANVNVRQSSQAIGHDEQYPALSLSYGLAEGVSESEALDELNRLKVELGTPAGIKFAPNGLTKIFQDQTKSQPYLIVLSLIIIYIILGVLYESYLHPLTILSTIPPAGIGAIAVTYLTNEPFNLMTFIAIVLLIGIVKKNAILIVDVALRNQRVLRMTTEDAILAACHDRFRPVLMTTLTALFGALPMVLATGNGAELRRPLGLSLLGGLLLSQLISIYTSPVLYILFSGPRLSGRRRPDAIARPFPPPSDGDALVCGPKEEADIHPQSQDGRPVHRHRAGVQ
ncbi:multidrug efflux pump [Nitrospirillum amazonense]|uniref:Multidrug efflux pump n=1 Tax=Nitrospirillum amazonense TaxID=28077 RepID=A0A560EK06_9PROT|nr:efflux RND transporter permease subunit [Nitrospirillum amazonense]TWB09676.1 multidrug efflux pump [Nitrospirillum amazonense]